VAELTEVKARLGVTTRRLNDALAEVDDMRHRPSEAASKPEAARGQLDGVTAELEAEMATRSVDQLSEMRAELERQRTEFEARRIEFEQELQQYERQKIELETGTQDLAERERQFAKERATFTEVLTAYNGDLGHPGPPGRIAGESFQEGFEDGAEAVEDLETSAGEVEHADTYLADEVEIEDQPLAEVEAGVDGDDGHIDGEPEAAEAMEPEAVEPEAVEPEAVEPEAAEFEVEEPHAAATETGESEDVASDDEPVEPEAGAVDFDDEVGDEPWWVGDIEDATEGAVDGASTDPAAETDEEAEAESDVEAEDHAEASDDDDDAFAGVARSARGEKVGESRYTRQSRRLPRIGEEAGSVLSNISGLRKTTVVSQDRDS
jgi:hypothetical protein